MLPSTGTIFISPFHDAALYLEQTTKAHFWSKKNFYGVDLSSMFFEAMEEHVGQPVVGPVDPSTLLAPINSCATHRIDFNKDSVDSLKKFTVPFSFVINRNDTLHGLACWFDVGFMFPTSTTRVTLSTAPTAPITHWYQCRLLFQNPMLVRRGQVFAGTCLFVVNDHSSYNITVKAQLKGVGSEITNQFFLHNVLFRCYWASTTPAPTTNTPTSVYDMTSNDLSGLITAPSPYLSSPSFTQTPAWEGGSQYTQPSQTGWLGPTAPLSPRRKMPRLTHQGTITHPSYSLGQDLLHLPLDTRPVSKPGTTTPSRTPHLSYDTFSSGYGSSTVGYNPYYGYGYPSNGYNSNGYNSNPSYGSGSGI